MQNSFSTNILTYTIVVKCINTTLLPLIKKMFSHCTLKGKQ